MTVTSAQFRVDYVEFSDVTKYSDAQVSRWLTLAATTLDPLRWGDFYDTGCELFAAHYLAIGRRNQIAADAGGVPGSASGPMSSKSVGGASVSYDTGSVAVKDGGPWNLTSYGMQFLEMARMVGSGGVQIGPDFPVPGAVLTYTELG